MAQDSADAGSSMEELVVSKAQLHVFGSWAFGKTDGNFFGTGTDDGNYENANLALNLSSSVGQNIRVAGQIEILTQPFEEEETEVELDFLLADWQISEAFHVRLGRVKHPFGISSEVFDVGTVRPFLELAPAFYGSVGVAGESVDGVSAYFRHDLGGGWGVSYDLYYGRLKVEASEPWDLLREEDEEGEDDGDEAGAEGEEEEGFIEEKDRDELIGGRLVFTSPSGAFHFGLSAYTGRNRDQELGEETFARPRNTATAGHIQYENERLWVRGEVFHLDEDDELEADGAYLEVAYFLTPKWQLAWRLDWLEADILEVELDEEFESLAEHQGMSLGLNYWFGSGLVLKTAVHRIEGNRFSVPESFSAGFDSGALDEDTQLFEIGVQLSF